MSYSALRFPTSNRPRSRYTPQQLKQLLLADQQKREQDRIQTQTSQHNQPVATGLLS